MLSCFILTLMQVFPVYVNKLMYNRTFSVKSLLRIPLKVLSRSK